MSSKGNLTVITGPMFSNKSGELLRQATVHRIAGRRVGLFKHDLDDRYEGGATISTHDGQTMPAEPVSSSVQLGIFAADLDLVAIDEGQFFDDGLAEVAAGLVGGFGGWYWVGIFLFTGMLIYQHVIVMFTDLTLDHRKITEGFSYHLNIPFKKKWSGAPRDSYFRLCLAAGPFRFS